MIVKGLMSEMHPEALCVDPFVMDTHLTVLLGVAGPPGMPTRAYITFKK